MKKSIIIIISLFVSTGLMSQNVETNNGELSWVDEQVAAIKPARMGAKNSYLGQLHNPFIFLKSTGDKKVVRRAYSGSYKSRATSSRNSAKSLQKKGKLSLEAIINQSALIDGKWYKEGQTVHGYKLEKVSAKSVVLKRGHKSVVLTTRSEHRSLKFNNN